MDDTKLFNKSSAKQALDQYIEFLEDSSKLDLSDEESYTGPKFKNIVKDIIEIITKAITYSITRTKHDKELESLINYILSQDIDRTVLEILKKTDVGVMIFREYERYLYESSIGSFTVDMERQIIRKNPWLLRLSNQKGFTSLNDMARNVLESIYILGQESKLTEQELYQLFDGYFKTSIFDYFIETDAEPFKDNVYKFKKYQIRLLLSDAYAREATHIASTDNEEFGTLEDIESMLEDGTFYLPKNDTLRFSLYKSFILELGNDKSFEYLTLGGQDKLMTLREANPLFFLD